MVKIKYQRLIALGCSHTYGHGLEDCFVPPKGFRENPSKLSWPAKLAELMQIENVINLSQPGHSNKYMLHTALNFKFEANDLIVALWTYDHRTGIFFDKDHHEVIASWKETKFAKKFLKNYFSSYDNSFQNSIYINYFNLFTKEHALHYYYDFVDPYVGGDFTLIKDKRYMNLDFNGHCRKYERALDGEHLNSQGHADFAKLWYEKIQAS